MSIYKTHKLGQINTRLLQRAAANSVAADTVHRNTCPPHYQYTTNRYQRKICREASLEPDILKWLASSLVMAPYFWSGGHEFESLVGENTMR